MIEKRARLEGKVGLLLHEFSELSTSKFFGANPEGTLKKTIETMIVNGTKIIFYNYN